MVESQPTSEDEQQLSLCVCNKPRDLGSIELVCSECKKWHHASCTTLSTENMLPFQLNYVFTCNRCHDKAVDHMIKSKSTFLQACITTLGNLMFHNLGKRYYCKDKDVVPFIAEHWDQLMPNRQQSLNWPTHIYRALTTESVFSSEIEGEETFYSLADEDLAQINPLRSTTEKLEGNPSKGGKPPNKKGGAAGKRKTTDGNGGPGKKSKLEEKKERLSKWGYPLEHPHNKDNYRYTLAQADPLAGDNWEQELAAGKPLPSKHYRCKLSEHVLLALHDKAQQIKVDDERTTATGEKGYCLVRATHAVKHGSYYFECTIKEMPDNSACRIGWAQQYANLQAPCGYDRFGYSWRSRKGTIFHNSRGKRFSSGYGVGDTLGFLLVLPKAPHSGSMLPPSYKDQALIKFKNHLYFEEKDESEKIEKALTPLPNSMIKLYKNGKCEGTAWTQINGGAYFPCVSIYKNCSVQINFGPEFKLKPEGDDLGEVRPISDLAAVNIVDHTLGDLLYHVEDRINTDT